MEDSKFSVKVNAKISVDRSTAECCLKIVEMYMNEEKMCITETTEPNGHILLEFVPDYKINF